LEVVVVLVEAEELLTTSCRAHPLGSVPCEHPHQSCTPALAGAECSKILGAVANAYLSANIANMQAESMLGPIFVLTRGIRAVLARKPGALRHVALPGLALAASLERTGRKLQGSDHSDARW
jgi:hypothetical protein